MSRRTNPTISGDRRFDLGRAAVDVASIVGYDEMTVIDIADAAGVVRRTFFRYFHDKDAAFEAGYRTITTTLRAAVQAAYDAESAPLERTRVCLTAIAEFLAADPAGAEALLVQGRAAGPGTLEVHSQSMRRLADLILANTADFPSPSADPRVVAETVAGGIHHVAYVRVIQGEVRQLPELVPQWSAVVMAPYMALTDGERARVSQALPTLGPTARPGAVHGADVAADPPASELRLA